MRFAAALTAVFFGACLLPLPEHSARAPIRITTPFDEYGNICWQDEQARLDNFAIQVQNDSELIAYIVVYAGRISCRDEAKFRGNRARNWVIKRGVDPKRVLFKDGGFKSDIQTVLSLRPRGFPFEPQPTLKKEEVSIRDRCVDKVFEKVLCLRPREQHGNQRIKR